MKKIIIPLAVLLLAACQSSKKENAQVEQKDSVKVEATADSAKTSDEVDGVSGATAKGNEVTFHGTISVPPENIASVSVTMGGVVKSTTLLAGRYVSRGSVVAVLSNPEFVTLQQTYLESNAQTDFLGSEYIRQRTLGEEQAASQKKVQQARADYLSMKSRRDAAATQLRLLGINPTSLLRSGLRTHLPVTAPISGYVSDVTVNIGKYMESGAELCKIVDKNHLMVKITAYERELNLLHIGQRVEFRVSGMGKETFTASVVSIGQKVDETSRSIGVFARINGQHKMFRPGMYITARVEK